MTPTAFVATALLMGAFVLAGGGYGSLYSVGRLQGRPRLIRMGAVCLVVALGFAAAIVVATPLAVGWKILIGVSAAGYAAIPPLVWRYLEQLHSGGRAMR
ncbi:MAG: hypothetical protein EPN72_09185 [Nevskiaceae bacterium]|nr:MAG: hypothetical protein EPN63_08525 [Nevskiaceae bacterium]TBR72611.1 MAG: hypothetical protein EPN72_09185 [Nevskiaceae bacterium]